MSACARSLFPASQGLPSLRRLATSSSSSTRSYAVQAGGAPRFQVFNRRTKWLQRERSALFPDESRQTDYLKDEVAMRLSERLLVGPMEEEFTRLLETTIADK